MWSMWTAPSDYDYDASLVGDMDEEEEIERCTDCGARWDGGEECEEWCAIRPSAEPALTAFFEIEQLPDASLEEKARARE